MIVKNRLLNFSDNVIYQDDDCLMLSLDSVLLSNFVNIKLSDKVIVDLCSGNAPIPMLLSFRTNARIFGVEIQKEIFDLGVKSILKNKMDNQIKFLLGDVRCIKDYFDAEIADVVTCNPPYFKYQSDSLINMNSKKSIARHEVTVVLEDIIKASRYLLKNGGTFAMVHRPARLMEILELMKKYGIEPKRIQFVYSKISKNANMLLIEGIKNGKMGLNLLAPLIIYDNLGNYNDNIRKMFGGIDDVAK